MSPMTSAERAVAIAERRADPAVMDRLRLAVMAMEPGRTYTVTTFKAGRRRTVSGTYLGREVGAMSFKDEKGKTAKVSAIDIVQITQPQESR